MYVTSCMQKTKNIFAKLIETLTSENRVFNWKASGFQRRSPGAKVWGAKRPTHIFLTKWINSWTTFVQNFKSVHIYMKDAECAETNEKLIFRLFWFLVFEVWWFLYSKLVNSSIIIEYKIDHILKTKNRNNRKIDFSFVSAHCASFI